MGVLDVCNVRLKLGFGRRVACTGGGVSPTDGVEIGRGIALIRVQDTVSIGTFAKPS